MRGTLQEIVDFEDWDHADVFAMTLYDTTFKKDFGPWKQGQFIPFFKVDFIRGLMQARDIQGDLTTSVDFDLSPRGSS